MRFALWLWLSGCDPYAEKPALLPDRDGDGFGIDQDCDDTRDAVYPGAEEVCDGLDNDCDGASDVGAVDGWAYHSDADGDGSAGVEPVGLTCSLPDGSFVEGDDCDDTDAAVHPDAAESCNGRDDDCDSGIDEFALDAEVYFLDADGDGHGDPTRWTYACAAPSGYVSSSDDCSDSAADVFPGAPERCGGGDEDCDGLYDEVDPDMVGLAAFYDDSDGDGFGDPFTVYLACTPDAGSVSDPGDCDDTDSRRNIGQIEVCDDEDVDEDCDGAADDADSAPSGRSSLWQDADLDGYGGVVAVVVCEAGPGTSARNDDCDDTDPTVFPDATESCDGRDEDCDGAVDEGLLGTWYLDDDLDSWGNEMIWALACTMPLGYVGVSGDCDDGDPLVYPGSSTCNPAGPSETTAGDTDDDVASDSDSPATGARDSDRGHSAAGDSAAADDTGAVAASSTAVRFIVIGDTGDGSTNQYAVADGIEWVCSVSGCDFALQVGDNIYSGGVEDIYDPLWETNFELPYANLDLQFRAVMGNHDWDAGLDPARLDAQVNYTLVSPKWYMPADYYTFVEENITFFGIDTHIIDLGAGAAQELWLPAERAGSTTAWNIAFGHHPYRSNGPHGDATGNLETFMDSYLCGQFDIYFSGHDHNLQWMEDECGTSFIVSGGGRSTYSLPGTNPAYFAESSLGFLWVEIDGDLMTGVFYDEDGVELYRNTMVR